MRAHRHTAQKIHRFTRINHTNTHRLTPKGTLHHPNDLRPPKSAPRSQTSCLLSYQMKRSSLDNKVALKDFSVLPWCSCTCCTSARAMKTRASEAVLHYTSPVVTHRLSAALHLKKAVTHQSDIKARLLPHVSRVPAKKLHLNTPQLTANMLLRSAPGLKEMPLCWCTNRFYD